MIMMTGTPNPLAKLKVGDFEPHVVDCFDKCFNVVPQYIQICSKAQAEERAARMIQRNIKFIYFANTVDDTIEKYRKWSSTGKKIAFSFSGEKSDFEKLDEFERKILDRTNEGLENSCVPQEFSALVTTSRNKEGINILNEDIRYMFVETHNMDDIIQMAGRVRSGLHYLYIIADAKQFHIPFSEHEIGISKEIACSSETVCGGINTYLQKLCEKEGVAEYYDDISASSSPKSEKVKELQSFVEKSFPIFYSVQFTIDFSFMNRNIMERNWLPHIESCFPQFEMTNILLLEIDCLNIIITFLQRCSLHRGRCAQFMGKSGQRSCSTSI